MKRPVIITCALTGGGDTTRKSKAVPVTPKEIADQAIAAGEAGAAIAHIHVRDPATGDPSVAFAHYAEVVERIRAAGSPVLINLTTGPGGLMQADESVPPRIVAAPVNPEMTPEERLDHVLRLKPDICSLDIASMNFGEMTMVNTPRHLRQMAKTVTEAGIKPELEVFDLGHIRLANHLIQSGFLKGPGFFQFCLGIPWGAPASAEVVGLMKTLIPHGAEWSAFAIGPDEFPMVGVAAAMGGHVRVGLEDNLYLERGRLAQSNAELVGKAARIVSELGLAIATPDEARGILGIA